MTNRDVNTTPIVRFRTRVHSGFKSKLANDLREATTLAERAYNEVAAVVIDIPSELPPRVGILRMHNAALRLQSARTAMMRAHRRLSEYLEANRSSRCE